MRYIILLAAVSFTLVIALGCADNSTKRGGAVDSYVQGVLAYEKGDTTKAMSNLQDAVHKDGGLIMARSLLGDMQRAKSDYEAAKDQYEALAQLDPYEYRNHFRLGLVYQLLDRLPEAATSYLRALDLKPSDSPSNMYLGSIFLALAEREPTPTTDEAKAKVQKLREKAILHARRTVELDPTSAAAYANLGVVLDYAREFAQGEAAYRKSLDLDSGNSQVRLYLGENLLSQGKFSEARSTLTELVRVDNSELNRLRLGDAYAGEKNFAEAINQYRAALQINPGYYPALNKIGNAHITEYKTGLGLDDDKRKQALDAWQKSLSMHRAQPEIQARINQYATAPLFDK